MSKILLFKSSNWLDCFTSEETISFILLTLKWWSLNLGVILLEDIKYLSLLHVKEFTNLLGVHVFHILTRTIAWEYIWWYHLTPSNCLSSVLKNLSMCIFPCLVLMLGIMQFLGLYYHDDIWNFKSNRKLGFLI